MASQPDCFNDDSELPIRMVLAALPPMTLLPAGWLRDRLDAEDEAAGAASMASAAAPGVDASLAAFLTAAEFGARRVPRRSADWVREQCARGRLADAYKEGGAWYIPAKLLTTRPTPEDKSAWPQPKWLKGSRGRRNGTAEQGND